MLQLGTGCGIGRGMKARFYQGKDVGMIECRCPSCNRGHRRKLFYTGYLPARIYCWGCYKQKFERFSHMLPDEEWEQAGF